MRIGTVLTLPGAVAAELLAEPFDLVWIDLEHGALGPADAQELIVGAQAAGTAAYVRLPADAHGLMATMLDAGADGVVLASVDGPSVAEAAVAATRHPPRGRRGYGLRRAGLRGRTVVTAVSPTVWAQIETRAGVTAAAQIAAVDGVDAVVVGTADLSFALGTPLEFDAEPLRQAVADVRAAVRGADVAFGLAGALLNAPPELTVDADVLVHSTDARLCAAAVDTAARDLRAVFASHERESSTP